MDEAKITNVVLAILVDDHELGFPELLVVGDLVVVLLSLTDLVDASVTVELDLNVLELSGVDRFELELEGLLGEDARSDVVLGLLEG